MSRRRDPLASPGPLLDRVYAYVAYRVGPGPLAEDITGDTLERALRYRETYDSSRGTPEAWIIGIARHCIADTFSAPAAEAGRPLAESNGFEESALTRVELAVALTKLDERDRELVALRYGADLDSRSIGRLLELTPGAVDVALHRALARLRGLLERSL